MTGRDNDNAIQVLEMAVQQFVDSWLDGQEPKIDEFVKDYPGYEEQVRQRIRKLHRIDGLLDSLVRAHDLDFQDSTNLPELVGQKLGSFEVGHVIGRGGMGVVYLARDTKLDRSVAIKSIPAELANDSTARTRFKREARLLASLNHPNIGAIYDLVEQDKVEFLSWKREILCLHIAFMYLKTAALNEVPETAGVDIYPCHRQVQFPEQTGKVKGC